VIYDKDCSAAQLCAAYRGECVSDVLAALGGGLLRLLWCVPHAAKPPGPAGQLQFASQTLCERRSLVVPAAPPSPPVERHADNELDIQAAKPVALLPRPCSAESVRQRLSRRRLDAQHGRADFGVFVDAKAKRRIELVFLIAAGRAAVCG